MKYQQPQFRPFDASTRNITDPELRALLPHYFDYVWLIGADMPPLVDTLVQNGHVLLRQAEHDIPVYLVRLGNH